MDSSIKQSNMNFFLLITILLLEGFVTISVEVLTIRQLIPVVGNTVIVTSLIIGVFLLFLALGYYRGGFYRANYRQVLIKNFIFAMLLLGFGLSYYFIEHVFLWAQTVLGLNSFFVLCLHF